jgi:hypothetical protein
MVRLGIPQSEMATNPLLLEPMLDNHPGSSSLIFFLRPRLIRPDDFKGLRISDRNRVFAISTVLAHSAHILSLTTTMGLKALTVFGRRAPSRSGGAPRSCRFLGRKIQGSSSDHVSQG